MKLTNHAKQLKQITLPISQVLTRSAFANGPVVLADLAVRVGATLGANFSPRERPAALLQEYLVMEPMLFSNDIVRV